MFEAGFTMRRPNKSEVVAITLCHASSICGTHVGYIWDFGISCELEHVHA